MESGIVIRHENVGEEFYMLYDETDINHCILLGEYQILEEAVKAGRVYKEKECPEAVVELYKMVKVL